MAISHTHKLIFVHNPKCAGTSIIRYFDMEDWGHANASESKDRYSKYWDEYKKFTVVRNPWDRFYSNYRYAIMEESYYHSKIETINPNYKEGENRDVFFKKAPHPDYNNVKDLTFEEYVDYWYSGYSYNLNIHHRPQLEYIHPEVKIIRYENLEQELSNWLGEKIKLPLINPSTPKQPQSPYTPELISKVEKIYLPDIKALCYDRP
jgi:hypothetical protein